MTNKEWVTKGMERPTNRFCAEFRRLMCYDRKNAECEKYESCRQCIMAWLDEEKEEEE